MEFVTMRSHCSRVGPTSDMTSVLIRREEMWTHREAGHVTRGRDWRAAATSQGTPRAAGATRSWRRRGGCSPEASEEAWPCSHLDFERPASRSERRDFCWSSHPVCELCYSSCGETNTPTRPLQSFISSTRDQIPQINPWGGRCHVQTLRHLPQADGAGVSGDSPPGEGP